MAILRNGADPQLTVIHTVVDNIHDTDLPAVKSDTGSIKTAVDSMHDTDLPAVKLDTGSIKTTVDNMHDFDLPAVAAAISTLTLSVDRVVQIPLAEASDAGDVVLVLVDGSVLVEAIVVKTVTTHANLTSIAVTGGAGKVIEFISAISGAAANLDAVDKQVSWEGCVELGDSKNIIITFAGAGAGPVTMLATIRYRPCTIDGALI